MSTIPYPQRTQHPRSTVYSVWPCSPSFIFENYGEKQFPRKSRKGISRLPASYLHPRSPPHQQAKPTKNGDSQPREAVQDLMVRPESTGVRSFCGTQAYIVNTRSGLVRDHTKRRVPASNQSRCHSCECVWSGPGAVGIKVPMTEPERREG